MTIIHAPKAPDPGSPGEFHIITFAEMGYSMLDIYGREFGIDTKTLNEFADRINRQNSFSSLHPQAPISAIPRHCIRDGADEVLLAREITDFLRFNRASIKAGKLLFDFRAGVAAFVMKAMCHALHSEYIGEV